MKVVSFYYKINLSPKTFRHTAKQDFNNVLRIWPIVNGVSCIWKFEGMIGKHMRTKNGFHFIKAGIHHFKTKEHNKKLQCLSMTTTLIYFLYTYMNE